MGKKDIVTKDYMKDNEVFADAFNFLVYGGKQVIVPQRLRPMDSAQMALPYGTSGTAAPRQGYRDGLKYLAAMTDETKAYLILGTEHQSKVHYAMPVRNMLYDAMQYAAQVEKAAHFHRQAKDSRGHGGGEFLSGFYKEDRLIPVVTLVICFHGEPWDGPLCIHDMLSSQDKEVLPFVENYRIHLIEPFSIKEEQLRLFRSSLREVVTFLKYSKDPLKLDKLVKNNARFQELDYKAARLIKECTGAEIEISESEGKANMCKAFEEWKRMEREEGIKEGKAEGIKEGRAEGTFMILNDLVKEGILGIEDAAVRAGVSAREFDERMKSLER